MATYESLYKSRCTQKDGKDIPLFWKPQRLIGKPLTLFADDTCLVSPEWGCESVISRILALGLHCEIPVGDFVRDAGKRDLPDNPILPVLLRSHVADEAQHDLGFRLAAEAYPIDKLHLAEASEIAKQWQSLDVHPIVPAAALEVGVFLASLGGMRLFGGGSLSNMAAKIAQDEFRHTSVNMAVMLDLGLDFTSTILRMVDETISWGFQGLLIPESETGVTIDREFFRRASHELIHTGEAQDLDDLVNYTDDESSFEIPNGELYSRGI
jgi:hypothetical protein